MAFDAADPEESHGTAAIDTVPADVAVLQEPYVAPVVSVASVDATEVSIIRRTASRVFLPPRLENEDDTPMVSRAWVGRTDRAGKKQLGGARKMAGNLPDWEPAPPGELIVTRRKRK
ncbi:MAG: hypothetical protein KF761_13955 [Salinibacterium sp.]|nr:hypothetical protein [Salinibacterium sp.]